MGQDVPLDLARRDGGRHAKSLAGASSHARLRGAAAHRRQRAHADHRRRGADADRAQRDQAQLPVPGTIGARPADRARSSQYRGADRHSVHRSESVARGATKGKNFPRRQEQRVQRHDPELESGGIGGSAAAFAARQGEREQELVRSRRRGNGSRVGSAGARSRPSDAALNDIALDVESEAAFGLLGTAARAAVPYLEQALAENAVVDLVPLAANARKSIDAAIADFRKSADGVRVDAAVTDLRLVDIEFDAKTLRVIAEADGTVKVAVTKLADK